jgi:hypothetical protein
MSNCYYIQYSRQREPHPFIFSCKFSDVWAPQGNCLYIYIMNVHESMNQVVFQSVACQTTFKAVFCV